MAGDDRSRFCSQCRKNVYNLSAMTHDEAQTLIRAKEGKVCIRYYLRPDGKIMTSDCPMAMRIRSAWRLLAGSVASVLGFVLWGGMFGSRMGVLRIDYIRNTSERSASRLSDIERERKLVSGDDAKKLVEERSQLIDGLKMDLEWLSDNRDELLTSSED